MTKFSRLMFSDGWPAGNIHQPAVIGDWTDIFKFSVMFWFCICELCRFKLCQHPVCSNFECLFHQVNESAKNISCTKSIYLETSIGIQISTLFEQNKGRCHGSQNDLLMVSTTPGLSIKWLIMHRPTLRLDVMSLPVECVFQVNNHKQTRFAVIPCTTYTHILWFLTRNMLSAGSDISSNLEVRQSVAWYCLLLL